MVDWKLQALTLAAKLFQSVHMQLSVPRYAAIDAGRGANLDLIDRRRRPSSRSPRFE